MRSVAVLVLALGSRSAMEAVSNADGGGAAGPVGVSPSAAEKDTQKWVPYAPDDRGSIWCDDEARPPP